MNVLKLEKGHFLRDILVLMAGTGLAQFIPVLFSPLLTRIYDPAQFGIFALYTSLNAILGTVICGRLEVAVVIPKEEDEARDIARLSVYFSILTSLLVYFFLFLFSGRFSGGVRDLVVFLPLSLFCYGINQVGTYFANRHKLYKTISISKILQSCGTVLIQLACPLITLTLGMGLIIGAVVGQFLAAIYLGYYSGLFPILSGGQRASLKTTLKKYRKYPLLNGPTALMDSFSVFAPSIFIEMIYGPATLGLYGLALRTITIPSTLIGLSFSQIFYKQAADLNNQGQPVYPLLLKVAKRLFWLGVPIFLVLVFFAPGLYQLVFGNKWLLSGQFARVMAFSFLVRFVASPVSSVFLVKHELRRLAVWQVVYFLIVLGISLAARVFHLPIMELLYAYVAGDLCMYVLYFYLSVQISKR
jgi:O-antigen/teichoic acid export membrane protein